MTVPPAPHESAAPGQGVRLVVVLSHPTQYYSPWFRCLAADGLVLRVFYLWDFGVTETRDPRFGKTFKWDVDLLSGYDSEFVPNASKAPGAESFRGFDNPGLPARIAAWGPHAILLFGYKWATHLRLIFWARRRRIPLIFRGDSHFIGRPAPGFINRRILGFLYRQFRAVTYVGKANRAYFETLGVPPAKLFFAPHAVNAALFNPALSKHVEAAAAQRRQLGIPRETRMVLFAGKFVPEKQPAELLAAFLSLAPRDAALVFVGDGPEKDSLVAQAAKARPGTVHFLPFANQSEMPSRYLAADLFALPSRGLYETWGLAVNEAMQMGRPCLVSDRVGCQQDLVEDGVTGWVFRTGDPALIRGKLAEALEADPGRFREACLRRVSGYSYAAAGAGLRAAVGYSTAALP